MLSPLACDIARADTKLVFGVYASDTPSAMVAQIRPTLDLVEQGLGRVLRDKVSIRLDVDRNYDVGVNGLTEGRTDFARLGPASYVAAKEQAPGIEILAAERFGDSKFFEGIICVNARSDITSIAQLKGKTFAFGDEQSTIGRYLAQLYLARRGITQDKLKSFKYLERHDRVGEAIGAGEFDAGALEGTIFTKLVEEGVPIRQLASFPNVTKPWVARAGLDERLKAALRQVLLGIDDRAALAALRFDGFLPADDSDYALTRASIKENWRFFRGPRS